MSNDGIEAKRTPAVLGHLTAIVLGLLPALVIPLPFIPLESFKTLLLVLFIAVAFVLLALHVVRGGKLSLPRHPLLIALGALPLVYVIAGIVSQNASLSFFGEGLEIDTVATIAVLALLSLLTSIIGSDRTAIMRLGLWSLIGAALVAILFLVQLVVSIPLEFFAVRTANLLGKWNDLAIYFGLFLIASLYAVVVVRLRSWPVWVIGAVSLAIVALVNFFEVWVAILVASALFIVLSLLRDGAFSSVATVVRKTPRTALLIAVIASAALLFHSSVSTFIGNTLSIYHVEARPSWGSTGAILQHTYAVDPFLGSGPNTFGEQWLLYKPPPINNTIFWNTDFQTGVSTIATAPVTTGLLGTFAWLLLLLTVLRSGIGLVRRGRLAMASLSVFLYIGTLYLLGMMLVYVPGIALTALCFAFLGLFAVSDEREQGRAKILTYPPEGKHRVALLAPPIAVALLSVGLLYGSVLVFGNLVHYQQGVRELSRDLDAAERQAKRARWFMSNDRSYRLQTEIGFRRLSAIAGSSQGSKEERTAEFQKVTTATIEDGFAMLRENNRNYINWLVLGRVYEFLLGLRAPDSYESARVAYEQAQARNPHNAAIMLIRARLEAGNGDSTAARGHIAQALQEKQNYTPAVFFLSQLEIREGKIAEAIQSSEAAALLSPGDPTIWFQLGFLQYVERNDREAIAALEQAVRVREEYSNARYFLGLAYYRAKRPADALLQFERIAELNPGNAEVVRIVDNLTAGRDPLAGLPPPANEPQTRPTLPVGE